MQGSLSQSTHTRSNSVSLGANHGYRFEGDTAILNAELAIAPVRDEDFGAQQSEHWALQLWACETPHEGGPLRGIKVAEAAVALPDAWSDQENREHREAAALAQLPPAQREYAMVLVLASGSAGRYDQVHDFSNYAARQQFAGPHLEGSVGYRFDGDSVVLQAENVVNPRAEDNLSGSLTLQLWALPEAYAGGAFVGSLLASSELDRLAGQSELRSIEQRVALSEAPVGSWRLALMLREWTSGGYVTRDYCNFAEAHHVSAAYAEPTDTHWRADDAIELSAGDAQHNLELEVEREPEGTHFDAERAVETVAAGSADIELRAEQQAEAEPANVDVRAPARAEEPQAEVSAPVDVPRTEQAIREVPTTSSAQSEVAAQPEPARPVVAVAPTAATAPSKNASPGDAATARTTAATASKPAASKPAVAKAAASKPVIKPAAAAPVAQPTPSSARVSVQTASVDDLAKVPGLNKKLAQAIVRARPIGSLDELKTVRGIGDRMLQQLRNLLSV